MDKSKIFIAQFYTENVDYGKYSEEINSEYCKKYGYGYYVEKDTSKINNTLNFPERSHTWYKPKLILDVIQQFNPEYIMFLDIDACVVDFNQEIESYIDPDYDMIFTEDFGHHSKMNGGVFIVKNTEWTRNFMNTWWYSAEMTKAADVPELNVPEEHKNCYGYFKSGLWHDQSCMSYLYTTNEDVRKKIKIVPHHKLNWREPFDGNFIYHGFAYGYVPYRKLNFVKNKVLNIQEQNLPTESLEELARIYPTDKQHTHNYFNGAYQNTLYPIKNDVKKLVEIGVLEGYSLMVWKHFFPNAQIMGLDINVGQCMFKDEERVSVEFMHGDNKDLLTQFAERNTDIDVFIDDGGHKMSEQQITFGTMFKSVKPGGIYILEDLHTSVECKMPEKSVFNWGDPKKTTTLDMLENFNKTGVIKSDYLTEEECQYLTDNIKSCVIYKTTENPSITSVIVKKQEGEVLPKFTKGIDTSNQLTSLMDIIKQSMREVLIEANIIQAPQETHIQPTEANTEPKIAVVFYCWAIADWKERTTHLFDRMKQSGLYDAADELHFIVADTEDKQAEIESFISQYPKFIMDYEPLNRGSEYRAIKKVEEIGHREGNYNVLYLHAKGVSNKFANVIKKEGVDQLKLDGINSWVDVLTHFVVDKWKECVDKLNEGYDTAGTACHHRWWWGNFWWASSRHIKKLNTFSHGSRWGCEAWIHEGRDNSEWESIKFYEQHHFRYNPYYTVIPKYLYDDSDKSDITFTIHKAEYGCFNEQQDEGYNEPSEPNLIDVTDKIREISSPQKIGYDNIKLRFDLLHPCESKSRGTRIYFSTSREPDITYVITTHNMFDDIHFIYDKK